MHKPEHILHILKIPLFDTLKTETFHLHLILDKVYSAVDEVRQQLEDNREIRLP